MARPASNGLDYFPLDCNLFEDDKIPFLIGKEGSEGFEIFMRLLCAIYSVGCCYRWGEVELFSFAKRTNFPETKIASVVNNCCAANLFSKKILEDHKMLTSKAIQRRYFSILKFRKRKEIQIDARCILITEKEMQGVIVESISNLNNISIINKKEKRKRKDSGIKPELSGIIRNNSESFGIIQNNSGLFTNNSESFKDEETSLELQSENRTQTPTARLEQEKYIDPTHPLAKHFISPLKPTQWQQDARWINQGRIPLENHPDIFLTPNQLERIFELYHERNIEEQHWREPFERVSSRLATKKLKHENLVFIDAYSWLIGWALEETIKNLKSSTDLARSRGYLNQLQGA